MGETPYARALNTQQFYDGGEVILRVAGKGHSLILTHSALPFPPLLSHCSLPSITHLHLPSPVWKKKKKALYLFYLSKIHSFILSYSDIKCKHIKLHI